MKEYKSKAGGRYLFNEDIQNLQALALSMTEMFKDCGANFVISGCGIVITTNNGVKTIEVSSGYAFLDGKIRQVNSYTTTVANISSIKIRPTSPTAPQITYASGETGDQYDDYAADVVVNTTSSASQEITATGSGTTYAFPNLRTAYFKHYGLVNVGNVDSYDSATFYSITAQNSAFNNIILGGTPIYDIFATKTEVADCLPLVGGSVSSDGGDTYLSLYGANIGFGNGNYSASLQLKNDGLLYISANGIQSDNAIVVDNSVTATSFIKSGGTSSQFLKADGSVDNNTYVTTTDAANFATTSDLNNYVSKSGGTISNGVGGSLSLSGGYIEIRTNQYATQLSLAYGSVLGVSGGIRAQGEILCQYLSLGSSYSLTLTCNSDNELTISNNAIVNGSVTASSFVKSGGTSSQFLKADGSVDDNTYATSSSLSNYLAKSGGTMTGNIDMSDNSIEFNHSDSNAITSTSAEGIFFFHHYGKFYFKESNVTYGTLYAANFTQSSDRDLKENFEHIMLTVEDIAAMPAVRFNFKEDKNKIKKVGTIAQDWQSLLPEVISKDKNGKLTMNYGDTALVCVIFMAKEIVSLKKEIANLKQNK